MPVTARRLTAAAGLLLALPLVAACSGDGAPAGWTTTEVGSLSLAHPPDWDVREPVEGSEFWQVQVQDAAGDDATVQLLLGPDYGTEPTAAEASARLVAPAQLGVPFEGWRSDGRTDVEVPGADTAERWDFTYRGEGGDRISGVWVFVADSAGRSAAIQLTGAPLDEGVVFDVVSSLRFDPDAPPVAADDV